MIVGSVPSASAIATQMNTFTAMGLEVAFTEIDIRMTLPATTALLTQQKADYQSMVTACMMVSKCVGITIWDYTDKYVDYWVLLLTALTSWQLFVQVFLGPCHILRPR